MDTNTMNNILINSFTKEQLARGNSQKTITYYTQALNSFMRFYSGSLTDVQKHHIIDYIIYLKTDDRGYSHPYRPLPTNLSPKTIHTYFIALRGFYNWLYDNGYMPYKVFNHIKEPKVPNNIVDILSQEEIDNLYIAFKTPQQHIILMLMLRCGLRSSELQYITHHSIVRHDNSYHIIITGKGNKQRLVPINDDDADYLLKYLSYNNYNLSHITYNVIKRDFEKLKYDAQIYRLHPHLLRHTFATYYIYNGGDSLMLQYILGHSSLDMVQKYVHLSNCLKAVKHKNN